MIRIGYANIRCCVCRDVGYYIVINLSVISVQPQGDMNIRIQLLKIRYSLFVNFDLRPIGVVLRPKGNIVIPCCVELPRHDKLIKASRAMAGGQYRKYCHQKSYRKQYGYKLFHPLVPPLETPSIIFFLNTRNRTISGTEMTTTAAIIAGIFSLPKPFSRMACIPLETR